MISFGYQAIHIIPILNGEVVTSQCRRVNVGGCHCDGYMQRLIQLRHPGHVNHMTYSRAEVRKCVCNLIKSAMLTRCCVVGSCSEALLHGNRLPGRSREMVLWGLLHQKCSQNTAAFQPGKCTVIVLLLLTYESATVTISAPAARAASAFCA